jgi:hypothetical protein
MWCKFILIFAVTSSLAVSSQTLPSDCLCTDPLIRIYQNDALRMAYRRVFEVGNPYKDSIKIHKPTADTMMQQLALVYNMPASALRDSLVWIFGRPPSLSQYTCYYTGYDSSHVHGFIPNLMRFEVVGQASAPWVADWLAGNFTTSSNTQLNQLMSTYNLTAQPTYSIPLNGTRSFTLKSAVYYNTEALRKRFDLLDGVVSTNQVFPIGDGCDIQYRRENNVTYMDYLHKCSDCFAGCIVIRTFRFKIPDNTCTVEYLGSYLSGFIGVFGTAYDCLVQPPPGGMGGHTTGYLPCTTNELLVSLREPAINRNNMRNSDFSLGPIPARHTITLNLPEGMKKEKKIQVTDARGSVVLQFTENSSLRKLDFDVAALRPGIYYLIITTYASSNTLKFVKY